MLSVASAQEMMDHHLLLKAFPKEPMGFREDISPTSGEQSPQGMLFAYAEASYLRDKVRLNITLMDYLKAKPLYERNTGWSPSLEMDTDERQIMIHEVIGVQGLVLLDKINETIQISLPLYGRYLLNIRLEGNTSLELLDKVAQTIKLDSLDS